MTALTFGASTAPLFGVYHPSTAPMRPRRAALLCNPFGEEAIRVFRPMKRLAENLAAAGIPAFRFDYLGTGDSAGEDELVSLRTMSESIVTAHEELIELSEVREVYWVGVRLGACAALRATAETRPAGVLLWEPVTDGPVYLRELIGLPAGNDEALGFPLSAELAGELEAGIPSPADGLSLKLVAETAALGLSPIIPPETEEWNSDDALNSFTMPVGTLGLIAREIENW